MKEEWKDIKEYEGLYQISNLGRVKSLKDSKGNYREKILKPRYIGRGYLQVILYKENKRKGFLVHRLVAKYFIDNPNNYPIINHKDENKTNNKVENLEWCTHISACCRGKRNYCGKHPVTGEKLKWKYIEEVL